MATEITNPLLRLLRGLAIVVCTIGSAVLAGCEGEVETGQTGLPYIEEYPAIGYATSAPGGRVGSLARQVESGETQLQSSAQRGYLESLLDELAIDPSSQVLVFSRTSLQTGAISPATPRAIYFNDDSYVAFIPGAPALEIAGYDPLLGPVFFAMSQDANAKPVMERELVRCLRCHDTYSLSGGGVPRFLLGSGYIDTTGELVSHEAWILTSQATPLRSRWGGWYVTGHHGDQVHLGNIVVEKPEDLQDLDALRIGNLDDLDGMLDTSPYLSPYSDIVALMVLEHQIEVQNLISRLRFESAGGAGGETAMAPGDHVEALVRAMLMVDAVDLTAPIRGGSGFAAQFERRGPFDSEGRSLRELDLNTRLFRYPLSYLIYSDAFAALPEFARLAVLERIDEVLESDPAVDGLSRLTTDDRSRIAGILADTLPEYAGL